MRTIKFRGKIKASGKWMYGDITRLYEDEFMQIDISDWDVFPETIGQFTGIVDRNCVEIYEGDIIQTYDSKGKPILHEVYYLESEARFATKLIGYENLNEGSLTQKWINELDFEVIGNVFDNNELLQNKFVE